MIAVRHATACDLPAIASHFEAFSDHYGTKRKLFGDRAYAESAMLSVIENHLVLVAHGPDGLMGFICGLVQPHFYNPAIRTLTQLFWFVPKAYRGTRAAVLLLNAFTAWGRANCDWVVGGLMLSSPVKDAAFLRRGFKPVELSYLLEVDA